VSAADIPSGIGRARRGEGGPRGKSWTKPIAATLSLTALLVSLALAQRPAEAADVQAPARSGDAALQQQLLKASAFAPKRGVFFEVSNAFNKVYLFGTIHAGKPEFYPLDTAVTRALASSSRVVLELDFTDPAIADKVAQAGRYPPGASLDGTLPPALMRRVESAMSRYGVSAAEIKGKKPWAITVELLSLETEKLGYSSMFASDLYLAAIATLFDKPISGLESADEQIAVFDGMSDDEQRASLEDTLAALEDGRGKAEIEAMVSAWASADPAALAAALERAVADAPPGVRALQRRLFDQRNELMAERIEAIVRSRQPAFVAIGAAHLVGRDSVVELLRKKGLTVRAP